MSLIRGEQISGSVASASFAVTASYAQTSSYFLETDPIFVAKSGSLATTGSNVFIGDQTVSGSILLEGGKIVSNWYGAGGIDIVAGENQYVELASNNSQSFAWVDNYGVYVGTNWNTNPYQWTFGESGYLTLPQVTSLTTQAGILSVGDIIIQSDPSLSWRFAADGKLTAPGGIEALSFTGSLQGTSSWAENAITASYLLGYVTPFPFTGSAHITGSLSVTGSVAIGLGTQAKGIFSHAEGNGSISSGSYSHAEGEAALALGEVSHAEGSSTQALEYASHAEGISTIASGLYSHAEGDSTRAIGENSHAEGQNTYAVGDSSHAEGVNSIASGSSSHAEGSGTQAKGQASHAEGVNTVAVGNYSHAEGIATIASGSGQHVAGYYNTHGDSTSLFIIGNGASDVSRSDIFRVTSTSVQVTGSMKVTNGITGSLFGTSSWAENALTASNIVGGKATHVPFFVTDTTLATSSLYQSGSGTIIINQDNATTANPEALYVWQPSTTSFNVISGKGNLDNYLQLNIQNTNQGTIASSDIVATANNGSENDNYIDMGINSENFAGFLGGPNDAYVYTHGHNFWIGNINDGYKTYLFNSSSLQPIITLNAADAEITGSLFGTSSWAQNATTASYSITSSYATNADLLDGKDSSIFATTGSNNFKGDQIVTGSLYTSGSNRLIGNTTLTGSLSISGSTIQLGNNTLAGNTTISGSIIISGTFGTNNPTVKIYGDTSHNGYLRFDPVNTNIDTSISASYIYVSGSTNDLYFSQNGNGYNNVTRLRWLEGNMYTGLLNGGLITTQSSTVYQISSGSGIVVNLNASINNNPYPVITYVNWPNTTASIAPLSASYDQSFVSIQSNGTIFAQGTPYTDGQFNTLIPIGIVIHQNRSTINAVQTFPVVAYGWKQRSYDFVKAFGPLKISGYTLSPSGSSTGSLVLSGGVAWVDGRNYTVDPNNPSYIDEAVGITTSKIYRYYQSGSGWVYDTNGGVGYASIDPTKYSNNGVLTPIGSNDWSIQRVFYFPNSATKALYVYYGNASYSNQAAALAAVNTEPFTESPNTAANAVYVGYMLLRNNADFTTPASYAFYASGLFRGSGAGVTSGGGGSATFAGLSDVSIVSPTNGQPVVYNSSTLKFENSSALTASLSGNATTATSASHATTSSYALIALSSSYALTASYALNGGGSGTSFPYTGSAVITGSLIVTGSTISTQGFTGSLFGTASWANNSTSASYTLSSSYAVTSSYALVADTLLGSVTSAATASYSSNFIIGSTLTLDSTLSDVATVSSTIVGSNNLFTQATGSYRSAIGSYTLYNGANARAGQFMTVWNGTTVNYTDVSTTDIGNTSDIVFASSIVTSNLQINAIAATSGWTLKMLVTYL